MLAKQFARWAFLILLTLILAIGAVGCTQQEADEVVEVLEQEEAAPPEEVEEVEEEAPPDEAPAKDLVITIPIQYTETFDISIMATAGEPVTMVYDTLVSMDTSYEYQPGALVESFDVTDDGTVTTFHLKEGITFHDGSPFNAEAVKWNVELVQTGGGCCAYLFTPVTEVEVVDEFTVAMHTDAAFPGLLFNLSSAWGLMMSKETYEACGEGYGITPECVAGTGPFMLEEWVQNDHFTLVRNPDYNWAPAWTGHEGAAKLDSITVRVVPEDITRLVELEAGDVQLLLTAPWREIPTYQDDPDYQVIQIPDATIWFVGFNLNDPMVGDIRTRNAIGHAIERELIKDTLYLGFGAAKTTYLASEIGGDQGGRLAEATQNMLAAVGVKAAIQQVDKPTYDAELEASNFEIILRRYTWDNNDILPWFHHSQYLPYPNYVGTNDTALDTMMDDADYATSSWEQRDVEYRVAHQYLIDTHYPWAPIFQRPLVNMARSSVVDFTIIPLRGGMSTEVWTMLDLAE
jgi:peptide/nickel transport system substrate-binding protein